MRLRIARASRAGTGGAARRIIGRCVLAAVGAGFFAISTGTFGADLGTGYSTAIAVPSHALPAGRRPIPAPPTVPPDVKPDRSVQRARMVDQLYEEIMRRSSPAFSSATNTASLAGAC
jgi:hypothetical protein